MALSVQNKNFLAVLSKLDVDLKQFPDLTFDGLFENIPEPTNYFFDWFIENITPDNTLTQSEQAIYFQLESTQSLPSEEEMNYVLSSCEPSYEELMSLDVNYINNLSKELEDLNKTCSRLSDVYEEAGFHYSEVIKKQNKLKEDIASKKKLLNTIKQDSHEMNLNFGSILDDVKMFLLKEPHIMLNLDGFNELLKKEEDILNKFNSSELFEKKIFNYLNVDLLKELERDLSAVNISFTLSEGFLKEKKEKIEYLTELLQKKSSLKSSSNCDSVQFYPMNSDGMDIKIVEEIKSLESKLFDNQKRASHAEVQKISDEYLLNKLDLNICYNEKLAECRDYMKWNWKMNSCLHHILMKCINCLENTQNAKKELHSKLLKYEFDFSSNLTNWELRSQRFKEVSLNKNQPLLLSLKNVMNLDENPENSEEGLNKVMELMSDANDDSKFITPRFRNDLQSSIKIILSKTLCGPTNQMLLAPIELLIKFQECKESNNKLSQMVKRLASRYVEAKETISKSDRKRLLLWIDFITNPQGFAGEPASEERTCSTPKLQ